MENTQDKTLCRSRSWVSSCNQPDGKLVLEVGGGLGGLRRSLSRIRVRWFGPFKGTRVSPGEGGGIVGSPWLSWLRIRSFHY